MSTWDRRGGSDQHAPPSLGVVVPTLNRPELLREALSSLAGQTRLPGEVVIVDEGSVPPVDTEALEQWLQPIILRPIRHAVPRGGSKAKNAGAAAVQADLVTFLDDDDLVAPGFVEAVGDAFLAAPELDVLFVAVSAFGTDASLLQDRQRAALDDLRHHTTWQRVTPSLIVFESGLVPQLLRSVPMAFQRPVFRRAVLDRVGGFKPLKTWWEGEWAIRAAATCRVGLLETELHRWRVAGQGYFTGRDTRLTEVEIEVLIKDGLRHELSATPYRDVAVDAAASAWAEYSRFLLINGLPLRRGFRAGFESLRRRPRAGTIRLVLGGWVRRYVPHTSDVPLQG